ncbi:MAG: PASTA domain-containing protein, partial [Nocardioidaceae bacterium]
SPTGGERTALQTPVGTRLVGYGGVAVAVPDGWGVGQTRCGTPIRDTVDFRPHRIGDRSCYLPQRVSSLTVASTSYAGAATDVGRAKLAGDIDGVYFFRTPLRQTCPEWPAGRSGCRSLWHGALVVPSRDVVLTVDSRHKATVSSVLGSMRLIPDGYTAVPDFTGLWDGRATPLAQQAGLVWKSACPAGSQCDMSVIEATDPAAGSVVPVGTTVTQVSPAERPAPSSTGVPPVTVAPAVTAQERRVAETFIRFARGSQAGGPFDTPIALGLGGDLITTISTAQSYNPAAWAVRIPASGYAERSPGIEVSALSLISAADKVEITSDLGACGGPDPVVPTSLGGAETLVSIRPNGPDSCIDLWSVVIAVNDVGQVVAATVYLGVP